MDSVARLDKKIDRQHEEHKSAINGLKESVKGQKEMIEQCNQEMKETNSQVEGLTKSVGNEVIEYVYHTTTTNHTIADNCTSSCNEMLKGT